MLCQRLPAHSVTSHPPKSATAPSAQLCLHERWHFSYGPIDIQLQSKYCRQRCNCAFHREMIVNLVMREGSDCKSQQEQDTRNTSAVMAHLQSDNTGKRSSQVWGPRSPYLRSAADLGQVACLQHSLPCQPASSTRCGYMDIYHACVTVLREQMELFINSLLAKRWTIAYFWIW